MKNDRAPVRVIPTETYFSLIRQQLFVQGQARVRVTGMSMWPLLRHMRDSVIIGPPNDIRVGDIVLFDRRNGHYALHRVIRKGKTGFMMAGDNQWFVERELPYDQVVGVVTAIERKGREIPRESFFLKMYSRILTCLALPRIYLRKAVGKAARTLRRTCQFPGKGAQE